MYSLEKRKEISDDLTLLVTQLEEKHSIKVSVGNVSSTGGFVVMTHPTYDEKSEYCTDKEYHDWLNADKEFNLTKDHFITLGMEFDFYLPKQP